MKKAEIQKELKAIGAVITEFMTCEVWSDDNDNHYFIDRTPIDWATVAAPRKNKNNMEVFK